MKKRIFSLLAGSILLASPLIFADPPSIESEAPLPTVPTVINSEGKSVPAVTKPAAPPVVTPPSGATAPVITPPSTKPTDTKSIGTVPAPVMSTAPRNIVYQGSDSLAIGDPLGNSPVTAKHDAGPALTHHPYGSGCSQDTCIRAHKRWDSPGTWRDDKSTGISKGWGGEAKSGGSSSSPTKSESSH